MSNPYIMVVDRIFYFEIVDRINKREQNLEIIG
jgi:hypothetical protein